MGGPISVEVQADRVGSHKIIMTQRKPEFLREYPPEVVLPAFGLSPEDLLPGAAGATFARHFGVPPDSMEDPFTGSATGGMAAYLWRYGLIESPEFVAEQEHWMNRPVEVLGARELVEAVKVGGHAVTVVRGQLTL